MSASSEHVESDTEARGESLPPVGLSAGRWVLFIVGFAATAVSLAFGFIWAYQGRTVPVFGAAFLAWTGYLTAHYGATGLFIDGGDDHGDARDVDEAGLVPRERWRRIGIVVGIGTLVAGMVIGVVSIRQEQYLFTTIGGVLFLGGYVVAHYAETDLLL